MAALPIGLTYWDVGRLVAIVCLPLLLSCCYVTTVLVCLSVIYVAFFLYRKSTIKRIPISGQGVLITGCDTGFGHEFAKRLDSLGFTVFAGCLSEQSDGAKNLKASKTGRLHVLGLNITKDDEVLKAVTYVTKVHEKSGCGLWALVNNAGLNVLGDIELCTMEMFYKISEVNMYGMVRVTKAFLPLIRKSKGRILNTTSVKGRLCLPKNAAYGITKFGGEAFSDVLRLEMLKFGVRVIVIEPGNYGGATGMLNEQSLKAIKRDFNAMAEKVSAEVQEVYNAKQYLEDLYKAVCGSSNSTYPGLKPVVDAMEDAVVSTHPKYRYLIDGSNSFYDVYCTFARLTPYLPESWMDYLVDRTFASGKQ
ncbi:D-beta-hydroxybutyrate dehydrogenase, mitochondrial-like isoform X2 [Mytilus californianus]|uniref:D-beta-hydroxybutyrate dehydrogenase, mitochondrial-like isoform X2 n=1 Tax=Mytilus californianus TaxID=6549 RepID=UPI00224603A2|nr:D-beta-hydroxybutyrate dehydrogenase, mitochondrial-like isoform X2 [Mytilus californianus]